MEPFVSVTAIAVPYLENDVNTDQITPVSRDLHPDWRRLFFARQRLREDGTENPDFPLNRPQFRDAGILVAGRNFGCGSSREGAVWAMLAVGVRCIVARSFADIYRDNCLKNGLLPVVLAPADQAPFEALVTALDGSAPLTVDLRTQRIDAPHGKSFAFEIGAAEKTQLLEGLDDIGLSLKHTADIAAWEARAVADVPWLQQAQDGRKG